ncbi:MAG: hypothetical protein QGH73_01940 [Rhodospirillales bacterium]|jgi:hypothetical protein|nr:hypothetical protein [Rhodospirillaceae bacterium]MDP6429396.1 hypothetical protein [Rhodospirillales bacterium]MDP6644841.1 hypothetical protein [Rhodospirillales bacterium]MDP6840415.1 hypothetical protein [Rhodospirillales bacterium]|tara:strand:+ start:772 stop:1227 length:456 start_codon:yes stop_codon:yes gene_type:complete
MAAVTAHDKSAKLWYNPVRQSRAEIERTSRDQDGQDERLSETPSEQDSEPGSKQPIEVSVRLFGILAGLVEKNPFVLNMPVPVRAGEVVARVQEMTGPAVFANPARRIGETSPSCRLFVNGQPIEDFEARLDQDGAPIEVEMILVLAYEGG